MIEFDNDTSKSLVMKIKYKYWEIWPYCLRPGIMLYNFKCWVWHRYSTIRCRELPHTWSDRRTLLLHASFEILTQFIDEECSPGHVLWYGEYAHRVKVDDVMKNVMDEMKELYYWWNTLYLKEYPQTMGNFWEIANGCGPRMLCVPYEGMPDCIVGQLKMVYENDNQRDAYKKITEKIRETEKLMDQKCEEMLKRLAAIRPWMWT